MSDRHVDTIRKATPRELLALLFARVSRVLRRSSQYLGATLAPSLIQGAWAKQHCDLKFSDERTVHELKGILQKSFFWSWSEHNEIKTEYRNIFEKARIEQVLKDAEDIRTHVFEFQGSGKTRLGRKIPWRQDLRTGVQWPKYKSTEVPVQLRKGSDIVRVWELSRFQWGPTLGKAYWFTGDDKYVSEFLCQIDHWCRENPIGYGPNWMTSQDAALRAISWILTLSYIGGSPAMTTKSWQRILQMLFLHGIFIRKRLTIRHRDGKRITGNHYASQLLGLFFLGLLFRCSVKGQEWLHYSTKELNHEISEQVLPDGSQYESSIACYHRFVLEHFLVAYLLSLRNGISFSTNYSRILEKMFRFIEGYTRPNGSVPQIGDTDDARLIILSDYSSWNKDNHLSLLYMYTEIYGRSCPGLPRERFGEECFWVMRRLKNDKIIPVTGHSSDDPDMTKSSSFPDSGFYFMKHNNNYMAISANPVGLKGKGNHKHNDILSFDLFMNGQSYIVDPGSYVYTSDPIERNVFRSTSYHNTVMIDDQEINPFTTQHLFQMDEKAYPQVRAWETDPEHDYFEGIHSGYTRLPDPLIHERRVLFIKKINAWLLQDSILPVDNAGHTRTGEKTAMHKISVFFHFAPLDVAMSKETEPRIDVSLPYGHLIDLKECNDILPCIVAKKDGRNFYLQVLVHPEDAEIDIEDGWYSPSYGIRVRAPIVHIQGRWTCPVSFVYLITPEKF